MTTRKQKAELEQPRIQLTPKEREIARKAMIDAIRHCRKLGAEILAQRAEAEQADRNAREAA